MGVCVVVVAVVNAAPHHSSGRHLRVADGTLTGGGGAKVLAAARGKRSVTKFDEEECDEWELLLSPSRKRPHQQGGPDDATRKREALEVDVGTGIIVQPGGITTQRPFRFPQNRPFTPIGPDTTTQRPINFPNPRPQRPQATPSPPVGPTQPQPPSTIYHNPFFPTNLFPSSRPNPFSPTPITPGPVPPSLTPQPVLPSGFTPGQTTPNSLFPGLPTRRPSFTLPSNLGPDYIHPTTLRPRYPGGFPFSVAPTTRKPCSCRNHTSPTAPPPVLFTPAAPIGQPVSPATPQILRPSPVPSPVTPRPQFPTLLRGRRPTVALGPPATQRPRFPSFTGVRRPSPVGSPVASRPQFPDRSFNIPRPITPLPGGFGATVRPNFTPFTSFPNNQARPIIIVPYNPQNVIGVNTRHPTSNFLLPRFPDRQPTNARGFVPAPSPLRVYYISQARQQAPKEQIKLNETTEK